MGSLVRDSRKAEAREVIETCVGLGARIVARRITSFLENRIEHVGLTLAQLGLMAHVAAATHGTIGALADGLELDPSTLSRSLHLLERDGLVEIAMVAKDLRRRAVWLTEAGARRLEGALIAWRKAHDALGAQIDLTEARQFFKSARLLSATGLPNRDTKRFRRAWE
jgi:DNA-binding MarR family transcriptional regulator